MRSLWSTGWLHNRLRVLVAQFLVKHLLLPWQWGLKHFWDTLLDADLECDALGWQYVAGCLKGECGCRTSAVGAGCSDQLDPPRPPPPICCSSRVWFALVGAALGVALNCGSASVVGRTGVLVARPGEPPCCCSVGLLSCALRCLLSPTRRRPTARKVAARCPLPRAALLAYSCCVACFTAAPLLAHCRTAGRPDAGRGTIAHTAHRRPAGQPSMLTERLAQRTKW